MGIKFEIILNRKFNLSFFASRTQKGKDEPGGEKSNARISLGGNRSLRTRNPSGRPNPARKLVLLLLLLLYLYTVPVWGLIYVKYFNLFRFNIEDN